MTEDRHPRNLAAIVDELIAALESLSNDLGNEREALRQRTTAEQLEHIALRKGMAVEHVSSLYGKLREALVDTTGDGSVDDAMSAVRSKFPSLGDEVARLVELTRTCQIANQENGALIGAGLRSTQGALQSLRELASQESSATYSSRGQTSDAQSISRGVAVRA